jgi:hypothetical protein
MAAAEMRMSGRPTFECTAALGVAGEPLVTRVNGWTAWTTITATVAAMEELCAYRIGDHEWYTATVLWHLGGTLNDYFKASTDGLGYVGAGCAWTSLVLFTPNPDDPRLSVLRNAPPHPLTDEEFRALGLSEPDLTRMEQEIRRHKGSPSEWERKIRSLREQREALIRREVPGRDDSSPG